jgi:hypothetical protein
MYCIRKTGKSQGIWAFFLWLKPGRNRLAKGKNASIYHSETHDLEVIRRVA